MGYNNAPSFENLVVFDIETIPDTDLAGELCDLSAEQVGAMSLPELRDAMAQYHIEKHNGNAFLRQPFHRIACISFLLAEITNNFGREQYTFKKLESYSAFNATEEEVVRKFWKLLETTKPRIVSFNGKIFDINVLKCKALQYGIDCSWYFNFGSKFDSYEYPYADAHFDLLRKYGEYTLHEMCIALHIPCKLGVDGSHVAEYFDDGKFNEIREYCETDVLATYLVYLRMAFVQGWIDKDEYNNCVKTVEGHLQNTNKKGLKEFLDEWYRLNPKGLVM